MQPYFECAQDRLMQLSSTKACRDIINLSTMNKMV